LGEARGDRGVAASCLLTAFGRDARRTDAEQARAMVGAILVFDALHELTLLRKALTTKG